MDDKSCYYKNCKNEITSSEHIPPKCLFPKGYRKELITVPSCDEHNTQKSNKDEYFRNILTLHVENNILGGEIAENKTFRSISRNRLSENSILKDFIPSIGVKIDPIKFNIIISGISYGLYRFDFNKNYLGSWYIINDTAPILINSNTTKKSLDIEANIRSFLRNKDYQKGSFSNPQIFQYYKYKENDKIIYKLIFYESIFIYSYTYMK